VRDLKVQFDNGTLATADKDAIGDEVKQLATEIRDIASKAEFNGIKLLDGTAGTVTFQVGAGATDTINVTATDFAATGASGVSGSVVGLSAATAAFSATGASGMLADIDTSIKNISKVRSTLGAVQNRLEHRLNNLSTYQENLVASESRIRDVDMASEMVNFTKLQILQQAGTSMLAQANQAPQGVLSLLR
jgi:flagellin